MKDYKQVHYLVEYGYNQMKNMTNQLKIINIATLFKNLSKSRRFKKLIQQLISLYYDPDAKGGYLHKRDMMKFIASENIFI